MIETIMVAGAVGFVAAGGGAMLAVAVQNNENAHTTRRLASHDRSLEMHTFQISEIVARKHCGPCAELDLQREKLMDERHQEMLSRMQAVERAIAQGFDAFRKATQQQERPALRPANNTQEQ